VKHPVDILLDYTSDAVYAWAAWWWWNLQQMHC